MPLVPPTATPIDANALRALQRHVIGLLSLRDGGPPLLVLELTDAAGEARPYVMSLNGAVQLATDLNGVLEGDDAIRALVKETFALARDLKATLARTDAPPRDHGPTHCSHLGNRLPGQCPHCPDAGEHIHPDIELPYVGEEG